MSTTESPAFWLNFFCNAGIPSSDAHSHAVSFTKHRIKIEMLPDLTKEYLNDMGVTMMGDVIAILKHAKTVAQQTSRDEALNALAMDRPQTPTRRSTAASRTVSHYLPKDDNAGPMSEPMNPPPKISQELASRLGPINEPVKRASPSLVVTRTASPVMLRLKKQKVTRTASPVMIKLNAMRKQQEIVPVPKVRRVLPEHEGKYKIKMPQGTTAKTKKILEKQLQAELEATSSSSVFTRLGQGESSSSESLRGFKVTGLDNINLHNTAGAKVQDSSVFGRLGGSVLKRPATSTMPDSSDTEEEAYHGILKHPTGVKKKKIMKRPIIKKMIVRAPQEDASTKEKPSTEGIFSPFSAHSKKSVTARLAPQENASTKEKPSTDGIFSPFSAHSKKSVTARLGENSTSVVAEAQSTTKSIKLNKSLQKKKAIDRRLGLSVGNVESSTSGSNKGVFSRLGKQIS